MHFNHRHNINPYRMRIITIMPVFMMIAHEERDTTRQGNRGTERRHNEECSHATKFNTRNAPPNMGYIPTPITDAGCAEPYTPPGFLMSL